MIISQDAITQEQRDAVRMQSEKAYQKIYGHGRPITDMSAWEAYHMISLQFDCVIQGLQMKVEAQMQRAYQAGLAEGIQRAVTHPGRNGAGGIRGIVNP